MDAKDDLRDRIRDGLPAGVLALMDEIEAFAGVQIVFAHNPYPPSPGAFAPLAAQVAVRHDVATIYLRDLERTDAQNVAHELLHIQRYWVDRVPQLRPKTDRIPALLKYIQTLETRSSTQPLSRASVLSALWMSHASTGTRSQPRSGENTLGFRSTMRQAAATMPFLDAFSLRP